MKSSFVVRKEAEVLSFRLTRMPSASAISTAPSMVLSTTMGLPLGVSNGEKNEVIYCDTRRLSAKSSLLNDEYLTMYWDRTGAPDKDLT